MRRTALVAAATAAMLAFAGGTARAAADGDVVVGWQVSDDGQRPSVVATITNTSATDWDGWRVSLPLRHPVSSVSGAISVQESDQLTLSSDRTLAAGEATVVRLRLIRLSDGSVTPSWCSSPQAECAVLAAETIGASPTPSPATSGSTIDQPDPEASMIPSSPSPTTSASPSSDPRVENDDRSVRLAYRIARDWGSGQSVVMSVTNSGTVATDGWVVEIPADVTVSSLWGAESLSGGGSIRAQDLGWNGYLAPGDTIEFGFTALPGQNPEWQRCRATVDEQPAACSIAAADSWLGYPRWPTQW